MSGNASEALRRARAERSLLEEEQRASELDQALAQVQSELAAAAVERLEAEVKRSSGGVGTKKQRRQRPNGRSEVAAEQRREHLRRERLRRALLARLPALPLRERVGAQPRLLVVSRVRRGTAAPRVERRHVSDRGGRCGSLMRGVKPDTVVHGTTSTARPSRLGRLYSFTRRGAQATQGF